MITVPVSLRPLLHDDRPVAGWYLRGGEPADWLREIENWAVPHASLRLYVLPQAVANRRPRGVLITVGSGGVPRTSPQTVPYVRAAPRLFVPAGSRFDPQLTPHDLDGLLSSEYVYVWNPATGLVAFEPGDALGIADLLRMAPPQTRDWGLAQPGLAFASRLVSLLPEQGLNVEVMLEQSRGDIGRDAPQADQLPPSPNEASSRPGAGISRTLTSWLARTVRFMAARAPAHADHPTWIDKLENWAQRHLQKMQESLDAARNKEIARLMHLLEKDPDQGLRYALPLGDNRHRGTAPPSGRLGERTVNFSLQRLGGGEPADAWEIEAEYRRRLTTRYRELADREIRLGRHRRAAYIFAELLGDLSAAASTLSSGRHWREAAVLYEQRLKQPAAAVECLEQGGLWDEAIELLVKLRWQERAGDLCTRLNQLDRAARFYHDEIEAHQIRGDRLSAARIYDEKLHEPQRALATLENGWPHSEQSRECLQRVFGILARLGRHADSAARCEQLVEAPIGELQRARLADILAEESGKYPDATVRARAADATRVVVSQTLPLATVPVSKQLLAAIGRLAPEDRLLSRDCQRYLKQISQRAPTPPKLPPKHRRRLNLLRTIEIPHEMGILWKSFAWSRSTIFAAGVAIDSGQLCLARGNWEGRVEVCDRRFPLDHRDRELPILLLVRPDDDQSLMVQILGSLWRPPGKEDLFPATDGFPTTTSLANLPVFNNPIIGATRSASGTTWHLELQPSNELILYGTSTANELIQSRSVQIPREASPLFERTAHLHIPCHAHKNVYLGLNNVLLMMGTEGRTTSITFPERIETLCGSLPHRRNRMAVTFASGGRIFWDDPADDHCEAFATELASPLAAINRGGYLIAANATDGQVYGTQNGKLELVGEMTTARRSPPLAILSSPYVDQFGIARQDGRVEVYELA